MDDNELSMRPTYKVKFIIDITLKEY